MFIKKYLIVKIEKQLLEHTTMSCWEPIGGLFETFDNATKTIMGFDNPENYVIINVFNMLNDDDK